MKMGINKYLLPIKLHFILRLGSSGAVFILLPLLMQQKGLSPFAIGIMNSVLPIIGLIISGIAGPLADYYRAHRTVFLASLASVSTGIFTLYFAPPMPNSIIISGNNTFTNNSNYQQIKIKNTEQVKDVEDILLVVDIDYITQIGTNEIMVGRDKSSSLIDLMVQLPFWFMFMCMLLTQVGLISCVMMEETTCFLFLGSEREKFGQQRLWGTISMGIMSVVMGAAIDLYSQYLPEKDYLPAFILFALLSLMNLIVVSRMNIPASKEESLSFSVVSSTLRSPNIILYLLNVLVGGFSLSAIWVYRLMLIEEVALQWDSSFPALKLLQGLAVAIEAFGGEVPCYFFAGSIIKRFGHSGVLSFGLLCISLRCACYFLISNPWHFLAVELLNGPSWGLYSTAMGSYASQIAPPGAQATLQAVVKTVFYCGWSLQGFIVGRIIMEVGISNSFLLVSTCSITFTVLYIIGNFVIFKKPKDVKLLEKNINKDEKGHLKNNIKSFMNSSVSVIMPTERKNSLINEAVIQGVRRRNDSYVNEAVIKDNAMNSSVSVIMPTERKHSLINEAVIQGVRRRNDSYVNEAVIKDNAI